MSRYNVHLFVCLSASYSMWKRKTLVVLWKQACAILGSSLLCIEVAELSQNKRFLLNSDCSDASIVSVVSSICFYDFMYRILTLLMTCVEFFEVIFPLIWLVWNCTRISGLFSLVKRLRFDQKSGWIEIILEIEKIISWLPGWHDN